jgi:hypothetical protein
MTMAMAGQSHLTMEGAALLCLGTSSRRPAPVPAAGGAPAATP